MAGVWERAGAELRTNKEIRAASPRLLRNIVTFAEQIKSRIPAGGLFAGQEWRIAARTFPLEAKVAKELESLGRVLLQFNRAVNLLYRQSVAGKQPAWVAEWLDLGKPAWLVELQRG